VQNWKPYNPLPKPAPTLRRRLLQSPPPAPLPAHASSPRRPAPPSAAKVSAFSSHSSLRRHPIQSPDRCASILRTERFRNSEISPASLEPQCNRFAPAIDPCLLRRWADWLLVTQMNKERLMKMAGAVRTGGKGTMRRYLAALHCPGRASFHQRRCR
jgi:hypothetical protein